MDDTPPAAGWDSLQKKIRRLHFDRDITGWREPADLFEAIALLCKPGPRGHDTTLNRWREAELARALKERVNEFGVGATPAQRLVDRWYAHRYALAIRLCAAAAEEFTAYRLRLARLDFQDLLYLTARVMRTRPDVRRQLGARYRRVLVDEFQDTDPLQAEIMLLLSSEPGDADGEGSAHWRSAVPRPGALFVVGDPKQSIYRFRRADIQLYAFVKQRFASFGEVVTLSTNFRSRPPIGDLVNEVFRGDAFFPIDGSDAQAPFERLETRPPGEPVTEEGVFWYLIDPAGRSKGAVATDDAARISSWIRRRVDAGERSPADFLILTWDRGQIGTYARALEAYGLPVSVTGAGVGVEHELGELEVLLECMIDPSNQVRVVAALVGLFFGIDYERLVQHRLAGGRFDVLDTREEGHQDVIDALHRLRGWWRRSTSEPADVFVADVVSELGLLPYAAAGELGSIRAGALVYALDIVRATALGGDSSLPGALTAIRSALQLREAEAPLEPGRSDAVRLMNLHQAKGLEGTVVVLACPTAPADHTPDLHVARSGAGPAEGYLRVVEPAPAYRRSRDLARPWGWSALQDIEERFELAEDVRLLYVAVTRAREELVVARWKGGRGASPWAPLEEWLDERGDRLALQVDEAPDAERIEADPQTLRAEAERAAASLRSRASPGFAHTTVTRVAKARAPGVREKGVEDAIDPGQGVFRGFTWGSAVHAALAAAMGDVSEEELRTACRNHLIENRRPLDDHGEPRELRELHDLVRSVLSSSLWRRASAAERSLVEIPFAVRGLSAADDEPAERMPVAEVEPGVRRQLDLFGSEAEAPRADSNSESAATDSEGSGGGEADAPAAGSPAEATVLEGVIDLAFKEADGWVVVDYKTDVGTDPDFAARSEAYRRQVELYGAAWSRLTGEPVKEHVLFFTSQDRVESW
jgi:ATP-dependent helicase/nuclease subunit A